MESQDVLQQLEPVSITIPPIPLTWEGWSTWADLQQSTQVVKPKTGVYIVKYKDAEEPARRLHIGKAANNQTLRDRIYKMVHGNAHSAGENILKYEIPKVGAENIIVGWAVTDRPAAAEEELHNRHKKLFDGKLSIYDTRT